MSIRDLNWKWGDRPCSRGTNLGVCYLLWNINCSLLPCLTETGIGSRRTPTGLLRLWQGVGREIGGRGGHQNPPQPGQSSNILCREELLEMGGHPIWLLFVSTFFISLLRGYQNKPGQSLKFSSHSFLYLFLFVTSTLPIFVTIFFCQFRLLALLEGQLYLWQRQYLESPVKNCKVWKGKRCWNDKIMDG